MLSVLKRFFAPRPRTAPPVPGVPTAEDFATRGRRWEPAAIAAPWFERPDALEHAVDVARRHGLGDQGVAWLRQWVTDGYFVVDAAVDARAIQRYADEFERVWWTDTAMPGLHVSDVTIAGEHHIHLPHEKLLAYPLEARREAHRVSNWR